MTEAHAREVAAIEEMTAEYCGAEPPARYGRSPAMDAMFDIKKLREAMLHFMSSGAVAINEHWQMVDMLAPIPSLDEPPYKIEEPQRGMGRPRKVAVKPGRKFSGMTRFPWRQRR
jgi:hypothetical protein